MQPVEFIITKKDLDNSGHPFNNKHCLGATAIKRQFKGFHCYGVYQFFCEDLDGQVQIYDVDNETVRLINDYTWAANNPHELKAFRKNRLPHVGTFT